MLITLIFGLPLLIALAISLIVAIRTRELDGRMASILYAVSTVKPEEHAAEVLAAI